MIGTTAGTTPQKYVFVADQGNDRVQKFSSTGTFLGTRGSLRGSGSPGEDVGEFFYPVALATDARGNVFVAEFFNHRVQKFACPG